MIPAKLHPSDIKTFLLVSLLGAIAGGALLSWTSHTAAAARNSSGTYSLPSGNPVVTHTAISSSAFNATMTDLAAEMTDSLSRSGKGTMTAALQLASGSVSAPGLTFSTDHTDGWYRIGTHDLGLALNGVKVAEYTSTDAIRATGAGSGSGVVGIVGGATETVGKFAAISGFSAGSINAAYFESQGTGPAFQAVGNSIFGASGTAVSASYGASFSHDFGTIGANTCIGTSQTLTGVSVGGVCNVSTDVLLGYAVVSCSATGANTVGISLCNVTTGSQITGTINLRVRVWQP